MLKIFCKNTGTFQEFQEGTTLLDMIPAFDFERPYDILSAKVNNVSEGLKFRVFNNRDVEFLDYRSYSGRNIYCRSLSFLLCKAVRDLY
ncbi:MAG: nucleoside kinase, partial [Bacteroidales bacterium]|nr:nucleoside kinase [Bacteroidales bacterium]